MDYRFLVSHRLRSSASLQFVALISAMLKQEAAEYHVKSQTMEEKMN